MFTCLPAPHKAYVSFPSFLHIYTKSNSHTEATLSTKGAMHIVHGAKATGISRRGEHKPAMPVPQRSPLSQAPHRPRSNIREKLR